MTIVAIIPARGGSKGVPRKNIRDLNGKPLIAHSILSARSTPEIDRVYVSTDDADITSVSEAYGAEVIHRPEAISGDVATSESALVHALDYIEAPALELVVFLQATSPLRQDDDISNAIKQLQDDNADSLFSAFEQHGFVWRLAESGPQSLTYDYKNRQRRQDIAVDVIENGSIYIFKPQILRQHNNRLGGKISVYMMNSLDSFQIDTEQDFETIATLMTMRDTPGKVQHTDDH